MRNKTKNKNTYTIYYDFFSYRGLVIGVSGFPSPNGILITRITLSSAGSSDRERAEQPIYKTEPDWTPISTKIHKATNNQARIPKKLYDPTQNNPEAIKKINSFEVELKNHFLNVLKGSKKEDIHISRDNKIFSSVVEQLKEYLDGMRKKINISYKLNADGFTKKILLSTARIPYGSVKTYREIAELAGSPRAFRACGNALAKNPLPLIIPCHRVVRSDGTIGQFGSGAHVKEMLLKLEGVRVQEGKLPW